MRTEKLSLAHRDLLYGRFKDVGLKISEYSFANLYLFRSAHDYEVLFDAETFISGKTYDGLRHLMPTSDLHAMDPGYLRDMVGRFDILFPIPEEWLSIFDPGSYTFGFTEGDMDYVFTAEKISTYKGKKLHKKRNLLSQFFNLYSHEAFPLTRERKDDALRVLDGWQDEMQVPAGETDYAACREALLLQEELLLCGGIYYADGQPAGFILGEEISPDMFALHFAKALRKYKGVYQFMYNSCAQVLNTHYTYLNFEQDLDKLPLRQAKSSYVPDIMIKKYRISAR